MFRIFENPRYQQLYFQAFTKEGEKDNLVFWNIFVCGFLCDSRPFFHFDIYRTRRSTRAGLTQGWWRPVLCSWQQTAPAAWKEHTRSFTATGNLKINLWDIFSQLPWVENSFMPGGKKVCRSSFLFFPSLFFFFFYFSFRVCYYNSVHSWYL